MNTHLDSTENSPYGPESRLLDHVRNWVDVFPWLRLVRVCRVAGGPVWLMHTLLVGLVWMVGMSGWAGDGWALFPPPTLSSAPSLPLATSTAPSDLVAGLPGLAYAVWPWREAHPVPANWKMIVWTIVLWLPTTMALLRVGALLTAGRDMPSYLGTFRAVWGRLRGAALIVILPTLVSALFWLIAAGLTSLAAWISGPSEGATWASLATLPLVLPSTLLAAILILGGRFAVPLALTALMIESAPDPIDSLSRGYEYTLRRLPQLVLLIAVATVIASVVILGFAALAYAGEQLADSFGPANVPLVYCLAILPSIVAVMLLWSMVGGIYLLLRQSAGGQEVEDIAVENEHWKSPKLPSVQGA